MPSRSNFFRNASVAAIALSVPLGVLISPACSFAQGNSITPGMIPPPLPQCDRSAWELLRQACQFAIWYPDHPWHTLADCMRDKATSLCPRPSEDDDD